MRWPSAGSKPVVSVSRTISRMIGIFLGAAALAKLGQNHLHLLESVLEALVRHNHEMGFCTLFFVRHLARMKMVELFFRHPRPCQDPLALNMGGSADHHDRVHVSLAAGFEQKRDI